MNKINLYFHIPFCTSKCHYCDFYSIKSNEIIYKKYFKALIEEIYLRKKVLKNKLIKTIYFGGGTPSIVESKLIAQVIDVVKTNFNISPKAEISIEVNPESARLQKLIGYRNFGINRISIGLQAWQNKHLSFLGRIHSRKDFINCFKNAKKAGFKNINIDMIFGFPKLSIQEFIIGLENIIKLNPQHISCYSLQIDNNSRFAKMIRKQKLEIPNDKIDRKMYRKAIKILKQNNFSQYEISNFCKKNFECKYNLNFWKGEEYLGFGAGAFSYFNDQRFNNIANVKKYIELINEDNLPIENTEKLSKKDQILEFIILRTRLIEGIDFEEFKKLFNLDFNNYFVKEILILKEEELIKINRNKMKLTQKGANFLNRILEIFYKKII